MALRSAVKSCCIGGRCRAYSQWLADCFAPECWSQIERVLLPRWRTVGRALSDLPVGRTSLMIAAAVPPPEHTAASWIPIAHPIHLVPDLYGGPVETFAALAASNDPGVVEMSALFTLTTARLRDLSHLHQTVFLAFRNRIAAVQNGQPLAGFEPKRFFKNIPLVDGDPSAGWFPPVSGKLSAALLLLYFSGGRDRMMTWDIHRNVRLRC